MNKLTSVDGTTIAFDTTGDGPPAVIVEGAFCDRRTSAGLATHLADRYTVFAYDRRGRGDSTDGPQWSVQREVEDLAAVISAAGGAAAVYGMSSGAVLAVEAAAAGAGVTRLALYEPPPLLAGDLADHLAGLVAADRRGDAVEHFLTAAVRLPAEAVAHMRTLPVWAGLSAVAHTLVYDTTITADPTVLARAATLAVPTMVLAGADSPWFLHDSARAMAAAVPGAELCYLDGQTHDVDPAVLAPELAAFFR
jgi:pimeloyl-ACP methyl ester carboxylesterase